MKKTNKLSALLLGGLAALALGSPAAASTHPNLERGLDPAKTYQFGDLDQVNLFNGNLSVAIPIGPEIVGNGLLKYRISLIYNSKTWDWEVIQGGGNSFSTARADRKSNAGFGWRLTLGELYAPNHFPLNDSGAWLFTAPDGAEHPFFGTLYSTNTTADLCLESTAVCYTRDGSFLRLKTQNVSGVNYRVVEFPDGVRYFFQRPSGTAYRLESIQDPFNNRLSISYPSALQWNLTESSAGATIRSHKIFYTNVANYDGRRNVPMVSRIELAAFGGTVASYLFSYSDTAVSRPILHNNFSGLPNPVSLPMLSRVEQPDGSAYLPTYQLTPPPGNGDIPGSLIRLDLPTAGRYEWAYTRWSFPTGESYNPQVPPRAQPDFISKSSGISQRRMINAGNLPLGAWNYQSFLDDPAGVQQMPVQRRTEVTDPSGHRTVHYFSVYMDNSQIAPPDATYAHYGLPFTPLINDGTAAKRFLSQEIFAANTTEPVRRVYVKYDVDANQATLSGTPSRRLSGQRTDYLDDGDKYRTVDYADFDGLGHYRKTYYSGNFGPSAFQNNREETTNYNPGAGTYPGSFVLPSPASPWVLGTYTERIQSERGENAKQEYCFDAATGFKLRERKLRFDLGRDARDLVTQWAYDGAGNLSREKSFGGDLQTLPTTALCSLALPANPIFDVETVIRYGALESRRYFGAPFYLTRQEIDSNTGLPTRTYDGAGIGSNMVFDAMGRLTWSKPDAGHDAWMQAIFTPATSTTRSTVHVNWFDNNSTTSKLDEEEYLFDGFGRLWREKVRLGGRTAYSFRETTTNAQGWVTDQTVWTSSPGTAAKTKYNNYDPFGRPASVDPPEGSGHQIRFYYNGERRKAKQYKVGFSRNSTSGNIDEHWAGISEEYDLYGRLKRVEQGSVDNQASDLIADYTYTVDGQLYQAILHPRTGGINQVRTFERDRRGFLLSEEHPETGKWEYSLIDPFGNATRKRHISGGIDLGIEFDSYARLKQVYNRTSGSPIKVLTYGTGSTPGNWDLGKIKTAQRFNRLTVPWNPSSIATVEVKETYGYTGRGGRLSGKTVAVPTFGRSFDQSYAYDALGQMTSLTYPRCTFAPCSSNPGAARTVTQSFNNGDLVGVSGWASLSYHDNGMVHQVSHQNGVTDTYERDPSGMERPYNVRITIPGLPETQLGYHYYDGMGNLVRRQIPAGFAGIDSLVEDESGNSLAPAAVTDEFYLYDDFGRLTKYNERAGSYQAYSYDPYGNITAIEHFSGTGTPQTRSYATSVWTNQPSSFFGFDPRGNMTNRPIPGGSETFTYDELGLVSARNTGAESYLYTADGERIYTLFYKAGIPNREEWVIRGPANQVLTVYDKQDGALGSETWTWKKDYVYRGGLMLAAATSDASVNRREHHFTLDHLGNPRLTTDKVASWPAIAVRHFYGYGEEYGNFAGDGEKLRFTGHERSVGAAGPADDLDYMHARYYSPFIARFQSPDPINTAKLAEPHTWNKYAYAAGNPLISIDPDGKDKLDVVGGWLNAVGSNLLGGLTRAEGNKDFQAGQAAGDKFSLVLGTLEMFTGTLTATGGLAVTAGTGGAAAPVGAPAVSTGGAVAAHGALVALSAGYQMRGNHSSSSGDLDDDDFAQPVDPTATVLQSGGHTITDQTAKKLNTIHGLDLKPREWGRALERLKGKIGLPNNHHGVINSDGTYAMKNQKHAFGNLLDFLY